MPASEAYGAPLDPVFVGCGFDTELLFRTAVLQSAAANPIDQVADCEWATIMWHMCSRMMETTAAQDVTKLLLSTAADHRLRADRCVRGDVFKWV